MHCTIQIALVELIGTLVPIQATLKIEMTEVDVTVEKDLPDALALISRNTKGFLLGKPERRARRPYSDDVWMIQIVFHSTKERTSAGPDVRRLVLQQIGI